MAIKQIKDREQLPELGNIRLGVRSETQGGYPQNVEYFVLDNVPEVKAVYGENPTELHAYLPTDEVDDVMPHFYKWFKGGTKSKDGELLGGDLQCWGDGETGHVRKDMDRFTRVVPTRPCLGRECPDWLNNGKPQCKPIMDLFIVLPRVSLLGVYRISSSSWHTIQNFHNQLTLIKRTWGELTNIPFLIYREVKNVNYIDNAGVSRKSKPAIMMIKPFEQFTELYGAAVEAKVKALTSSTWKPNHELLLASAPVDLYPLTHQEMPDGKVLQIEEAKVVGVEEIAESPELSDLFAKLTTLKKKENTPKLRLLTTRKYENEPNLLVFMKSYLESQIEELTPKAAPATPVAPTPVVPTADNGGLI